MSTTHRQHIRRLQDPDRRDIGDTPQAFLRWLDGPSLIRITGRDETRCRVFSTLLHGNEPSGLEALHGWLLTEAVPAVDLVFFVGSVEAALAPPGFAYRMLPGRRDLNRCFVPPPDPTSPPAGQPAAAGYGDAGGTGEDLDFEGLVARELLETVLALPCEVLVDVHNNTGQNPPYGFVITPGAVEMSVVSLFGDACVLSDLALGTLIEATAPRIPSVVIECGRSGDPDATRVALAGLTQFAETERLGHGTKDTMILFQRPVRVKLRPEIRIAFADEPRPGADLTLASDLERHNFRRLPPGTPFGWLATGGTWPLDARGGDDQEVSDRYFTIDDGRLIARDEIVPIMITTDERVAAADCLFYLVERHAWRAPEL